MRVHLYRDATGEVLYRIKVTPKPDGSKVVRPYHPVGEGWKLGLNGQPRILYRLPELLAADPAEPVWVTEGERDADALAGLGHVATTNPGGAGKWRDDFAEQLTGRRVLVAYDDDEPGHAHARKVEASLRRAGATVEFRRAASGNDLVDHLIAGLGVDDLLAEAPQMVDEPRADRPAAAALPIVFQLAVERLQRLGCKPKETDSETHQHEARCPAHDDRSPEPEPRTGQRRASARDVPRGLRPGRDRRRARHRGAPLLSLAERR